MLSRARRRSSCVAFLLWRMAASSFGAPRIKPVGSPLVSLMILPSAGCGESRVMFSFLRTVELRTEAYPLSVMARRPRTASSISYRAGERHLTRLDELNFGATDQPTCPGVPTHFGTGGPIFRN